MDLVDLARPFSAASPPDPKDPACVAALAAVRASLLAMPEALVRRPGGEEAGLPAEALAFVAGEARLGTVRPPEHAEISVLALALARAQHKYIWEPFHAAIPGYAQRAVAAEDAFAALERGVRPLLRRGEIMRADLPTRPSRASLDKRCAYVLALVDALRDVDADVPHKLLSRAENVATELHGATPFVKPIRASELYDRANTALRCALDRAGHRAPRAERSGTFVVDHAAGVVTSVRGF